MNFIGYTYKKDFENERTSLIMALKDLEIVSEAKKKLKDTENDSTDISSSSNQTSMEQPPSKAMNARKLQQYDFIKEVPHSHNHHHAQNNHPYPLHHNFQNPKMPERIQPIPPQVQQKIAMQQQAAKYSLKQQQQQQQPTGAQQHADRSGVGERQVLQERGLIQAGIQHQPQPPASAQLKAHADAAPFRVKQPQLQRDPQNQNNQQMQMKILQQHQQHQHQQHYPPQTQQRIELEKKPVYKLVNKDPKDIRSSTPPPNISSKKTF